MDSPYSSSSLILASLLLILVLLSFISPTCSTSRGPMNHHPTPKTGFRVALKHVDSGKNLTKFERLQRAMKRGKHRLDRLNSMSLVASSDVQSPVHAGAGEFLVQLAIGSPPKSYSAILDTGSDLIWTQCKPCKDCFTQTTPIFDPTKSTSYSKLSCSSKLCTALPVSKCGGNACEYLYTYGDQSSTQGTMATETFTFDKVEVPNIGFGCGVDNEGGGFSQGAGLVGLGRGKLSLVSQLDEPKFSYCLTSIDDEKGTSTLLMGTEASVKNKSSTSIKTTPLLKNPSFPSFYYLSLKGITVGDTKVGVDNNVLEIDSDGNGGMIIDSGTTITYLESSTFALVKKEFIAQTNLPVDDSGSTGLDVCFVLPKGTDSVEVPKLVFDFDGASLDLPAENYMIADTSSGVACLAMGSSDGMSIFGNVQQQNMLVVHDLQKETLSFLPTQCDQI